MQKSLAILSCLALLGGTLLISTPASAQRSGGFGPGDATSQPGPTPSADRGGEAGSGTVGYDNTYERSKQDSAVGTSNGGGAGNNANVGAPATDGGHAVSGDAPIKGEKSTWHNDKWHKKTTTTTTTGTSAPAAQ